MRWSYLDPQMLERQQWNNRALCASSFDVHFRNYATPSPKLFATQLVTTMTRHHALTSQKLRIIGYLTKSVLVSGKRWLMSVYELIVSWESFPHWWPVQSQKYSRMAPGLQKPRKFSPRKIWAHTVYRLKVNGLKCSCLMHHSRGQTDPTCPPATYMLMCVKTLVWLLLNY